MAESEKTARRPVKRSRCAIYTRKSTDEGLEQAFNSLDAQREACAAFILSQKHEGWTVLPTLFDDGGYSGGTMERPALQRLLADIEAGQIDVVVVYKVDRLSPTHRVYAVIKKEGREKGTWLEIGAAWPHRDGKGYGVTLNFIPRSPDAELVIRAIEPKPAA